jgi:cytochrome c-type biogenesis protein CcmH/NrfG
LVYAGSRDYSNTEKELEHAVQLDPGNVKARYRLALDYGDNKQLGLADLEFKKIEAMGAGKPDGEYVLEARVEDLARQLALQNLFTTPYPAQNHQR